VGTPLVGGDLGGHRSGDLGGHRSGDLGGHRSGALGGGPLGGAVGGAGGGGGDELSMHHERVTFSRMQNAPELVASKAKHQRAHHETTN